MKARKTSKRKRQTSALPVLGAAGVSFTMVGGASAAAAPTANVPSVNSPSYPVVVLDEEEISDISLATFYVLDRQSESLGERLQLAQRGCRGCRGCGCRGCGVGWRACGVGCGGCGGGCGPCWRLTAAGWVRIC